MLEESPFLILIVFVSFSVLVNVWNNASFPNYKSSLGWNKPQPNNAAPVSSSGAQRSSKPVATTATGPARAEAPVRRSGPKVPGGW